MSDTEQCGFDPGKRMFMCRAEGLELELAAMREALEIIAGFRDRPFALWSCDVAKAALRKEKREATS